MSIFKVKRVCYISMSGLTLYLSRSDGFEKIQTFDLSADGAERFSEYLSCFPAVRTAILVDLIEEEFKVERVPLLRGPDRRSLHERKLSQQFRSAELRLATSLEQVPGQRRDERILLAAINNVELLAPWLRVLQRARTPLVGVFSVAFLVAQLAPRIRPSAGNLVVVSYQEGAGLRQTLIANGKLLISRLAPVAVTDSTAFREALLRELDRTEKYINKLHLVEAGAELDVLALVPDSIAMPVDDGADLSPVRSKVEFLKVSDALTSLQGKESRKRVNGNEWICSLLDKPGALPNYAGVEQLYYRRQHDIRLGLNVAAMLLVLLCSTYLLTAWVDMLVSARAIGAMNERIASTETEFQRILALTPHTDVEPDLLRDSVLSIEQLIKNRIAPAQLLRGISAEVRRYGSIEIERIAWIDAPVLTDSQTAGSQLQEFFVDAYPVRDVGSNDKVIILRGRVTTLSKGYKDIFSMLNALSDNIRQVESIKDVRVVQLPIDRESSGQVQGQYMATDRNLNADFVLRAVYEG